MFKKNLRFKKADFNKISSPETKPFCGWYDILRIDISCFEDGIVQVPNTNSLLLVEFSLADYVNREIEPKAVEFANSVLTHLEKTKTLIVRWLYSWDENDCTEPEKIETVEMHLSQVAGVTSKHKDSVLLVQGLIIGKWGEMHSSKLSNPIYVKKLYRQALKCYDGIPIAVRTVGLRSHLLLGNLNSVNTLGIFNDAIMGSKSDLNTFETDRATAEKVFNGISQNVAYGGELVFSKDFDAKNCYNYLKNSGAGYLNINYDKTAIDCLKKTKAERSNCSVFDLLCENLGYNFKFKTVNYKDGSLNVGITNLGFSRNYKKMKLIIKIISDIETEYECVGNEFILPGDTGYFSCLTGERGKVTATVTVGGRKLFDGVFLGRII